jgi:hypothetical protein
VVICTCAEWKEFDFWKFPYSFRGRCANVDNKEVMSYGKTSQF